MTGKALEGEGEINSSSLIRSSSEMWWGRAERWPKRWRFGGVYVLLIRKNWKAEEGVGGSFINY